MIKTKQIKTIMPPLFALLAFKVPDDILRLSILGAEGISLQFRHIASYLLWYCCHDKEKTLLHEVVAVVGYFAVQHRDNQRARRMLKQKLLETESCKIIEWLREV
ncbi:hypothetical protein RUM43_004269 [Polyplax serrata]|uniref:Uncharacterized protein n=1 Tax=Polyplax serrata TaxID=468196 RepID=A0AAN8SAR8_POLSC